MPARGSHGAAQDCLSPVDVRTHGAAWVAAAAGVEGVVPGRDAPPQWVGPATCLLYTSPSPRD
eukprot:13925353-Alexandrium_andersonii.AAC.1